MSRGDVVDQEKEKEMMLTAARKRGETGRYGDLV